MSDISTEKLIEVAKEAAKVATDFLVEQYHRIHTKGEVLYVEQKTSDMDLVTEIDRQAQKIIVEAIQKHFPDHRFLAEEDGAEDLGDSKCPYEWIIDPLDGTTNFIHGKRNFGTIITVRKHDHLLAGAMYLPFLDQWFWGGRECGAYYNGKSIKLRETGSLSQAVLHCNLIHRAKDIDGTLHVTVPHCRSIENYGCAAEEMGEVLMGHTDGVFFERISLWDIACGFLLIEEAGGRMQYEYTDPNDARSGLICAASTAPIFDELWEWTTTRM